jgi:hypothetical protein
MKIKIGYIVIVLLFFSVTALKGQDRQPEPRRTAAEQAAFEKTIPANPAKIAPATQLDPKMDPALQQPPPTNWKPVATPVDDRKVVEPVLDTPAKVTQKPEPTTNRTQPEGAQAIGKPENHREVIGQKNQPEAPKPAVSTDTRKTESTGTQPEGQKPN